MTDYILSLSLLYTGLYLFFVISKTIFHDTWIDSLVFCPVCGSFFIGLLLGIFVFHYPPSILAFQIGLSMTGISMYLKEEKDKRKIEFPFDFFILQLVWTIIGLLIIRWLNI
ncbi:MAG: hypothetical protein AABY22_17895 [Nanoarchaeota archaeon]